MRCLRANDAPLPLSDFWLLNGISCRLRKRLTECFHCQLHQFGEVGTFHFESRQHQFFRFGDVSELLKRCFLCFSLVRLVWTSTTFWSKTQRFRVNLSSRLCRPGSDSLTRTCWSSGGHVRSATCVWDPRNCSLVNELINFHIHCISPISCLVPLPVIFGRLAQFLSQSTSATSVRVWLIISTVFGIWTRVWRDPQWQLLQPVGHKGYWHRLTSCSMSLSIPNLSRDHGDFAFCKKVKLWNEKKATRKSFSRRLLV